MEREREKPREIMVWPHTEAKLLFFLFLGEERQREDLFERLALYIFIYIYVYIYISIFLCPKLVLRLCWLCKGGSSYFNKNDWIKQIYHKPCRQFPVVPDVCILVASMSKILSSGRAPGVVFHGLMCMKTRSCSTLVFAGMTTAMSRRRVSCRELGTADCDGWLWKKRKESSVFIAQKWQRFWFILKGPALYWYSSQQVGLSQCLSCPQFEGDYSLSVL